MKYWVLILACFCNGLVNAQQKKPVAAQSIFLDDPRSPIVWIDSIQTDMNHLVIDKSCIDSINIIKDSVVRGRYDHTIGSLIIFPKPTVEMIRWPALLERLGVPDADRKLRVCINKTLVRQPAYLLIQPDFVKTIEITTERHWLHTEDANSKEFFLNIITKDAPLGP